MKLVTVSQMQELERLADARGLSYAEMMDNAGRALAKKIQDAARGKTWRDVLGLVGAGNNGGDTLLALTRLSEAGWQACGYVVKRDKKDKLIANFIKAGGEVIYADGDKKFTRLNERIRAADVLLDGLLGTGAKLPLREDIAAALEQCASALANLEKPPFIVAVDCPSGIDCDAGEAAPQCLHADLTVTMAAVKQGMLRLPAFKFLGRLVTAEIGFPDSFSEFHSLPAEVADERLAASILPERPLDAHKGTFGTALIAAGCLNYTGAALLTGQSACRVGAGLATLAVPEPLHAALAGRLPEATWVLLPHKSGFIAENAAEVLLNYVHRATAFLIGPGLGFHASTKPFVEAVLTAIKIPAVIDADGLRHLEQIPAWHTRLKKMAILTPHVGEMAILTGLSKEEIQLQRGKVALQYAQTWGHVVVLKGAFTVIAAPDGRMTVIPVATAALARAGTGDLLAGMIVGLRAQRLDAYHAAVAGAYIHAQAGLLAEKRLGSAAVTASDVLANISDIMKGLEGYNTGSHDDPSTQRTLPRRNGAR
ncbi:MAG: bifunctional ADP-dependent NAD(P)H-hydrate dehydratase/NAD(P)H-hydrate epimerase [Anaerolineales bacterium]